MRENKGFGFFVRKTYLRIYHNDLLCVFLHVEREMVAARERPLAAPAYVGFGPGMFAMVSRELVGASEAPRALLPRTFVRLFAWIEGEQVGYKIRNQSLNA